jgi:hypothetical protein
LCYASGRIAAFLDLVADVGLVLAEILRDLLPHHTVSLVPGSSTMYLRVCGR